MYDYLRDATRALRNALLAGPFGSSPRDGEITPPDYNTNAARWRLVLAVAIPYWLYVTVARMVMFGLLFVSNPGLIIASPWTRALQHLLLFPLLIVCYRAALAIGWPARRRVRAVLGHVGLGLVFAVVARPVLLVLVSTSTRDWTLLNELTHSKFGVPFSADLWISTGSDFFLSWAAMPIYRSHEGQTA